MTLPNAEEQLAALHALSPTPEAVADRLRRELDAFEQVLREAEATWDRRMPDREWSPAQEAEHVILVNEGTARIVRLLLSDKPLREVPEQPGRIVNGRRLAPEGTEPGPGQPLSTLLDRHAAARALLVEFQPEPNPARTFYHPFLGRLDALDWLRMTTWHTRNHRKAMRAGLDRLKADGAGQPTAGQPQ